MTRKMKVDEIKYNCSVYIAGAEVGSGTARTFRTALKLGFTMQHLRGLLHKFSIPSHSRRLEYRMLLQSSRYGTI
jgi:hypothetical protein